VKRLEAISPERYKGFDANMKPIEGKTYTYNGYECYDAENPDDPVGENATYRFLHIYAAQTQGAALAWLERRDDEEYWTGRAADGQVVQAQHYTISADECYSIDDRDTPLDGTYRQVYPRVVKEAAVSVSDAVRARRLERLDGETAYRGIDEDGQEIADARYVLSEPDDSGLCTSANGDVYSRVIIYAPVDDVPEIYRLERLPGAAYFTGWSPAGVLWNENFYVLSPIKMFPGDLRCRLYTKNDKSRPIEDGYYAPVDV
jgi:hypothetical protein